MRRANGTNYAPGSTVDGLVSQRKCFGGTCKGRPFGPKATTGKKKKAKLETGGRRVPWGLYFLIAVCSLPRHVEVSSWITAMQEFMSVIFTGAIQARPGPFKHSQ